MNPLYHGTTEETTFYKSIEKLTNRELQERQANYLYKIEKLNRKIHLNLQFWFYFAITSMVIGFLIIINQ
jgi:hypothetical protein